MAASPVERLSRDRFSLRNLGPGSSGGSIMHGETNNHLIAYYRTEPRDRAPLQCDRSLTIDFGGVFHWFIGRGYG